MKKKKLEYDVLNAAVDKLCDPSSKADDFAEAEHEIDAVLYALYGLDKSEIALIEEQFK